MLKVNEKTLTVQQKSGSFQHFVCIGNVSTFNSARAAKGLPSQPYLTII